MLKGYVEDNMHMCTLVNLHSHTRVSRGTYAHSYRLKF